MHVSTLVRQLMQEGPHASIEPVIHDALIVPETKPLDDLLADLQRQRTSMANGLSKLAAANTRSASSPDK